MKKIEQVYREILFQAIEKYNVRLTQLDLSKNLGFSLSTVNHALSFLKEMNSIKVNPRNFNAIDAKKILFYWASIRNLKKEIVCSTRIEKPIKEIESEMPDSIVYGAYSAFKFKFKDVPADYSEIYIYGNDLDRFKMNNKNPNLFIIKKDCEDLYGKTTTIAQTFVDLWNMKEWYAKDFLTALEDKIGKFLE